MKVEINRDAQLIVTHISVGGIKRTSSVLSDEPVGVARETESRVEVRVENVTQHQAAKELAARVRALVARYATNTPLGWLTDSGRLAKFKAEWEALRAEIREHNNEDTQKHRVDVDCMPIPIGVALDAEAQRLLCATVREALSEAKASLEAKDWKAVQVWLQRHKNLSALMPGIVGTVVDGAISAIRTARSDGAKAEKDGRQVVLDLSSVDDALNWVLDPVTPEEQPEVEAVH